MVTRKTTKLTIAHSCVSDVQLVGILEQWAPTESTQGRKIALILHGSLGHKDYLFQKRLAHSLPQDSFRFDFRGSHESSGQFRFGGIKDDVEDLADVVAFLQRTYGYVIDLLIGHSRGSIVALNWFCSADAAREARGLVNISGRYRMHKIYDRTASWQTSFSLHGHHILQATVARQPLTLHVTPGDLADFASFDTSGVWDRFPGHVHVLTVHGLSDEVVPPYDALIYARALSSRQPGAHSLHLMEDANHLFTNRHNEVVDTILEWKDMCEGGVVRTGIWKTGVRGRL